MSVQLPQIVATTKENNAEDHFFVAQFILSTTVHCGY
jgi:hypothetical protein